MRYIPVMSSVHDHNRRAWDERARKQQVFTRPASNDEIDHAEGLLAANEWIEGSVRGKRLLCLAAGGGRQAIRYAAAGAIVTVVDISPEMLALDRQVAAEKGLAITTVAASMDDLSMLDANAFDVVMQPVSTCYVPDVQPVFDQVARVTCPGGVYISQHKQPGSLQADVKPSARGYELIEPYYRTRPLPEVVGSRHREAGTVEFLHRWEQLIGGMCRSGFVIEDLMEPRHYQRDAPTGSFADRSGYLPPYVLIKARRTSQNMDADMSKRVVFVG